MRLIFHIGMGKTGSSSIQHALASNNIQLSKQNAQYLGMWFDMIDNKYRGVQNQSQFFDLPKDEILKGADRLIAVLREKNETQGFETFLFSNEALSGRAQSLEPLIFKLQEGGIEVSLIGYARDPSAWLASAYVQWGIHDKTDQGPLQPFATKARTLVSWYNGLLEWHRLMGEILTVRPYDLATDIVSDFAEAVGVVLEAPKTRVYERVEDAEIFLRARFNSRFDKTVLPDLFNKSVFHGLSVVPTLDDILARSFDYAETSVIVAESAKLFDEFFAAFGFDLREAGVKPPSLPDAEELRRRLLDAVMEISLEQARRIHDLEYRISKLENRSQST